VAHILLVHGSCHGAWCWDRVVPALARHGHAARAIDLPAHGDDRTPAGDATLDLYAGRILAAIDAPTVLVGHSAAGYPITLAAALGGPKVAALVYLCAYVPAPGLSMIEMRRAGPRQPLAGVVRTDPGGLTYSADPAGARRTFYHDCDDTTAAAAIARLGPEPVLPQATPLPAGAEVPAIPRHYVICTDDRTIPPEYQADMSRPFGEAVTRLAGGHSPFLTRPDALAALIAGIVSR